MQKGHPAGWARYTFAEHDRVKNEALEVLEHMLSWRSASGGWERIERLLDAMIDAVGAADLDGVRKATTELELRSPARNARTGDGGAERPPAPVRERVNRLIHSLDEPEPAGARPVGSTLIEYHLVSGARPRYVGIVGGDLRNVRCAEVWVNSENTTMRMARVEEFSVSSIIRYEGAVRGPGGRVLRDTVADDLERKVARLRPVPSATAITTGPGELSRFGVRKIVHVAAVQGEPGAGFRQVREIGRCVTNALAEIDRDRDDPPPATVLFPLLGAGGGGGDLVRTVESLLGAVIGYFRSTPASGLDVVYFLAYSGLELATCRRLFAEHPELSPCDGTPDGIVETLEAAPRRPAGEPGAAVARRFQMGFIMDVIGYGSRSGPAQEAILERLAGVVDRALDDCGTEVDALDHQWSGDGLVALLPTDIDPTATLPTLLRSFVRRLAEDNARASDRLRLRMAVGMGIVGPAPTGYSGPMVVTIARLVDSPPLRAATAHHHEADMVAMVSDQVYTQLVQPGYAGLPAEDFRPEHVAMKELEERAWVWVPPSGG